MNPQGEPRFEDVNDFLAEVAKERDKGVVLPGAFEQKACEAPDCIRLATVKGLAGEDLCGECRHQLMLATFRLVQKGRGSAATMRRAKKDRARKKAARKQKRR